jgi:DNA-binding CsgD family transcriptional regulator
MRWAMPGRGVVQSPVLVGRDDFVILAERRLAEVAAGSGQLLLVTGEAGIGKTRLLGAIARGAQAVGFAVVRAAAFPGDMQSFAGLLMDLASDLIPAPQLALRELGRSLSSRVRGAWNVDGDAHHHHHHHHRRLLVQDMVDLLVSAEPGLPVLIILEDLHWADQLSLDVLGHLASRLATRSVLVAAAYRSDELYPNLPLRDLRARLLAQRLAEEIALPRLAPAQTAAMTSAVLGRPAPAQVVTAIHERSDGIPLHVEELLAAIDQDADRLTSSFDRRRPADPWSPLSAREFEVAQLVASGHTNRQIAQRLVLAPKTISAHVEHILTKLGAARRTEIATWCTAVRLDRPAAAAQR